VLRDLPRYRGDFMLLSGWGVLVAAQAWQRGPWLASWLALYWVVQAGALLTWLGYRLYSWRQARQDGPLLQGEAEVRRVRAA